MSIATQTDRGGRPPNLHKAARQVARVRGRLWIETLRRQADAGDAEAIRLLLDLAKQQPDRASAPSLG